MDKHDEAFIHSGRVLMTPWKHNSAKTHGTARYERSATYEVKIENLNFHIFRTASTIYWLSVTIDSKRRLACEN